MGRSSKQQALAVSLLLIAVSTGMAAPAPHILTDIPRPLSAVSVHYTFPTASHSQQMTIGGESEVLLTVRNGHSSPINVTDIAGSINSPLSFAMHMQNLTTISYKAAVPPNSERSFAYRFQPSAQLPSRAYAVALTAFYTDTAAGAGHATTFFNQTVELVEPVRFIDTEAYSLFLTLAAMCGGIVYMVYRAVQSQAWFKAMFRKSKKSKTKVAAPSGPTDKSDYLVGTSYHLEQKKRAAGDGKKAK